MDHSPFLRSNSSNPADILADMAVVLVDEGGTEALTVRKLSGRARMSAGWVQVRFGDKARVLTIIASVLGDRWIAWLARPSRDSGLHQALPVTQHELVGARVWLSICELGRRHPGVGQCVAEVRHTERAVLARLSDRGAESSCPDEATLDCLVAVIDGLRVARCAPEDPMPSDRARAALDRVASRASG